MNDEPVLKIIRKRYQALGGQMKLAKELSISPQYMNDIVNGRRPVSEEVGEKLGFEKIWRKKKNEPKH